MKKILKNCWVTLAVLIIFLAILSSVFRALTPWICQYKAQIERKLSLVLGQPVQIGSVEAGWYFFEPVIKLKDLHVNGRKTHFLNVDNLLLGINLFNSLWHWQIQPGVLYINNAQFSLHETHGHWTVDGLSNPIEKNQGMKSDAMLRLLTRLALQEKLVIKQVSANLYFSDGTLIPIHDFNLNIINRGGQYSLSGDARLAQTLSSSFKLLGNFHFDPAHLEKTKGEFFVRSQQVLPAQLQAMLPENMRYFEGGRGNLKLWADMDGGRLTTVQALINFRHLALNLPNKQRQLIQAIKANLAWSATPTGWRLEGDNIQLRMGGTRWPTNQFKLNYEAEDKLYKLYLHSILLESLLSEAGRWDAFAKYLSEKSMHGELEDSQFYFQNSQLTYVLSAFNKLGWQPDGSIPGVNQLSGALSWQPQGGHLEVDALNALMDVPGYPVQTLSRLDAVIDWKQLSEGLRVSIGRLVMSQPELTLSSSGVLDKVKSDSLGFIHLVNDVSAKNLQKWLPYLPQKQFKPKLVAWLQNDVEQIAQAEGRIIVTGKASDFPFDNQSSGVFSINSSLSGVNLRIGKKWPYIRDIDANLKFNKRDMSVDIHHADIQGVATEGLQLKLDGVGLDKEELLIRGKTKGLAKNMTAFVMASPLSKKLKVLDMLTIDGDLALDLNLTIPLYDGNDTTKVLGTIDFEDNSVAVHHRLADVDIQHLGGQLSFNEDGISKSLFNAQLLGYPFEMSIKSFKKPTPYTKLIIQNNITAEELRRQYKLPVFKLMEGQFLVKTTAKISADPNDLDRLSIESSLQGLAINLPQPFGKSAESKKNLDVHVDINPEKGLRLLTAYDGQLSGDLWFSKREEGLGFYSGELRLGGAPAILPKQSGLGLIGRLSEFDLKQWTTVADALSNQTSQDNLLLAHLKLVDLKINKATLLDNTLKDLALKAYRPKNKDWTISVQQEKVIANLNYKPESHALSGHFKHLQLSKSSSLKKKEAKTESISPEKIPDLNVKIDNFQWGDALLGELRIKSHSKPGKWVLDSAQLQSPTYHLKLTGQWSKKKAAQLTKLHALLSISDLGKTLDNFNMEPVIDSAQGESEFKGGWPGSIFDFSLASLSGEMYIGFKNGRITHLNKETEEKLGLGKLLSILSLQTIPRRLKLDFSDLSQKGYSFDQFRGNFDLSKGIIKTSNSYIDGPVAYVGMKGSLNLIKHLYDLELKVSPHITASLPIVATIAGGPVAGIAAWVASKIINKGMQKISAYTYKISGPWKEPVVQQVSIDRRRLVR